MAEADIEKLAYEAQVFRQQGEQLQAQIADVGANVAEMMSALDALKELKNKPEVSMVPLGSGVYIKGGKIDARTVLVGIGANMLVERPIDDAIAMIDQRIEASRQLSERLEKALTDINDRLTKIDEQARRVIQKQEEEELGVRPSKK